LTLCAEKSLFLATAAAAPSGWEQLAAAARSTP
jgi:hypothetical protein